MERIFYFSGYRMTVFDWDEKTLINSRDFLPNTVGFADFEYLLQQSIKMPARLLVDMIEEDFRRESIPHVNMFDRRSLINRLIDKHYRDEPYVHAKVLDRSKLGRKDDRLLLSALTNTALLAPWLERIDKYNARLAGIWSIPLLTDKLLRPIVNEDKHALIVSRQVRSALRNSYFRDGKLLLSRQAKFDKDMWDKEDFEGVIANLERGTIEIYNFLLNQRIMESNDYLNVYCILQEEQMDEARQLVHNTPEVHYAFFSIERLFTNFGILGCEQQGAAALFSYLCTRTNPISDHYGTEEQKSTYYQYLVDKVITQATEIGSLICITAAVILALNSLKLDQEQEILYLQTNTLQIEYDDKYSTTSNQLETAVTIQTAVELIDQLERDAAQAPHRFFADLGSVFSQPQFTNISLEDLAWTKYPSTELGQLIISHKLRLAEQSDTLLQETLMQEYYEQMQSESAPKLQATFSLNGRIATDGYSYRSTIDAMQNFVTALERLPGVELVLLIETAVDVRDSARFTGQVGQDESGVAVDTDKFEIFIVLEPPKNA
ncbi:MAG: hypothetical protein ACI9B8_003522 [Sulfitobacter sp.]|jgi:hypothetical protein